MQAPKPIEFTLQEPCTSNTWNQELRRVWDESQQEAISTSACPGAHFCHLPEALL